MQYKQDKTFFLKVKNNKRKQGPTWQIHMTTPLVFRYLFYSTTLAKHDIRCLKRCLAFGWAQACLFLSVQLDDYLVITLMGGHITMA